MKSIIGISLLSTAIALVQAKLHHFEFNITSQLLNPDCHQQGYSVPLINGQFPGPTIHVNQGDEVEILVRNMVQNHNTSIHYHGIRQIGTVEADGVPGVTQSPILPNSTYVHKFKLDNQAGTYFYHAHVGLQDDSVKGAFIVYESDKANPSSQKKDLQAGPYTYKKDLVLQLGEWWHDDLESREEYYLGSSFAFDHGADSIMMNGRTVYDPNQKGLSKESCQGYTTFDVEPNTTYRLRVIGATTFRTLGVAVKDHNMTLIEVDGELTHPYNTSFLEVMPGQRYSALLQTGDHLPGTTFAIGTSYLWRQRGHGVTENGFGYIRYVAPSKNTKKEEENTHLFKPIHRLSKIQPRAEWLAKTHSQERSPKIKAAADKVSPDPKKGNSNAKTPNTFDNKEDNGHGSGPAKVEGGPKGAPNGGFTGGRAGGGGGGGGGAASEQPGGGRPGNGGRPSKPEKVYVDLPTFPKIDEPDWFYHNIKPLSARNPILDQKNVRTIHLASSYNKLPDNTTRYMVNHRIAPHRPVHALKAYNTMKPTLKSTANMEYNPALDTYPLKHNETIDLVFQNTVSPIGGCLIHPWHTHGHSHYLIASGPGQYEHARDKNIMSYKYPLYRDTTAVYPSVPTNDTTGCGWTKVRILADNPGFWAVHCHITTHMIQGKMVVLEEAPELIEQKKRYK